MNNNMETDSLNLFTKWPIMSWKKGVVCIGDVNQNEIEFGSELKRKFQQSLQNLMKPWLKSKLTYFCSGVDKVVRFLYADEW
jgi:hypothetical protein